MFAETANKRSGLPSNVAIATVNHSGQSVVTIATSMTSYDPAKTTSESSSGFKIKASVVTVPVYSESYTSNALSVQVRISKIFQDKYRGGTRNA